MIKSSFHSRRKLDQFQLQSRPRRERGWREVVLLVRRTSRPTEQGWSTKQMELVKDGKQAHTLFGFLRNTQGMTLIEIMIVIAIIAGLMAVLGTTANEKLQKSRVENAKIQINEISKSLDSYNLDCNIYPTTDQGLQALLASPGQEVCSNWGPSPYLKEKQLKDPWGKTFIYESDGATFMVKSLGRDGKEGGDGYEKDLNSQEL